MHNLNKYWKWDGGYEYPTCFKVGGIYLNTNRTQSDVDFDHYILVENVYGDDERSHEPNVITMRRVTVSDDGDVYAYYKTKVNISCQDGYFWYTEDADRVSSQNELQDLDLAEKIRQWSSHGVSKMSFNDMVKSIRNGTRHIIVKSQNPIKHLWIKSEEYAKDIISDIKRNGNFDYCSNIRDFLEIGLADDMYVKEGNRYYLLPSQFDEYTYQFRLYDGTLITNVYEKTPLPLSDIARAVSDTGYGFVVYKDATVDIDESYYSESNEILYYVYV